MHAAPVFTDSHARHIALTAHARTLLVEAGAGSGKTALLAGRIALMCAAGIAPRDITAITFTEAAASELRERIVHYVQRLAQNDIPPELTLGVPQGITPQQRTALQQAQNQFDELICTTIHGFCQRLIQPYPVEAKLDPGATIADATTMALLRDDIVTTWLAERFGRTQGLATDTQAAATENIFVAIVDAIGIDEVATIRRWADYMCNRAEGQARPPGDLRQAASDACTAIHAFAQWYADQGLHEPQTANWIAELQAIAEQLQFPASNTLTDAVVLQWITLPQPDACVKNGSSFRLYRMKTAWEKAGKAVGMRKAQTDMRCAEAAEYFAACGVAYIQLRQTLADTVCHRVVGALGSLQAAYVRRKQATAVLDFDDLLHCARRLVRDEPAVRTALALRYPHILVDEFQDTDPVQAELLWRLCGTSDAADWTMIDVRPGSLFVVADPKQAIYRFRGADIATYLRAKEALCRVAADAVLEITTNFRSHAAILDFVNTGFEPLLGVPGQPGFTALVAADQTPALRPSVQIISVDAHFAIDYAAENIQPDVEALRTAEARAVAEAVAYFLQEHTVTDRKTRRERQCLPGDIALLAATGSYLWLYEQELEQFGIPIASQAGKGFFRRQEIHDLIALVRTLADPRDTIAFGALLRGPLIGLSEVEIADALLCAEAAGEIFSLHTPPELFQNAALIAALQYLQALSAKARRTTPYQLLAHAVDLFQMRALLQLRLPRGAERALANIDRFLEIARAYDVRGLFALAQTLREQWSTAQSEEEGRLDDVKDAVLISTMHAAKGLEWPIVIPINSMTKLHAKTPFIHVDRTTQHISFKTNGIAGSRFAELAELEKTEREAEAVRLWYVALTRARELLAIPYIATGRDAKDWFSVIPLPLHELPPVDGLAARFRAADPQLALAPDAATWDMQHAQLMALRREVTVQYPSRTDDKASNAVDTVAPDDAQPVDPQISVQGSRRRGILLHKLLEECITGELVPQAAAIAARTAILHGQLADDGVAASIDIAEITGCVERTLALPEIAQVLPRLSAEVPLYAADSRATDLIITAGIADAVAWTPDGKFDVVIDWKSDVDPARAPLAAYRGQLEAYMRIAKVSVGLLVFVSNGTIIRHTLAA